MLRRLALALALMDAHPVAAAAPGAGGFATDNVTYVKTVPFEAGSAWGGRVVGKHFYVGSYRSFSIYDVSDPQNPELLSVTPFAGPFTMEDLDTDGEVLLATVNTPAGNALHVFDVEDKTAPVRLAELPGAGDHTMTCIKSCTWAYGSNPRMTVVDLRDPAEPRLAGSWAKNLIPGYVHDVTEVAPGRVMTSSSPMLLLDVARPTRPRLLAAGYFSDAMGPPTKQRFAGSNRWPRGGRDDFLLVNGESPFHGRCDEEAATFSTWDMKRWRTGSFAEIDAFELGNGTYADGNAAAGAVGCTPLWFQHHPRFRDGGLVAVAAAEHGTRFLRVSSRGRISETGWFLPYAGIATAAYWIDEETVYSVDFNRGIDILTFAD